MSTAHRDGDVGFGRAARAGRHLAPPGEPLAPVRPAQAAVRDGRTGRRAVQWHDQSAEPVLAAVPAPRVEPAPDRTPASARTSGQVPDQPVPAGCDPPRPPRSRPPVGVIRALLHSAVALQAEGLLRAIGALAVAAQRSDGTAAAVDWIGWVERDVRDLGHLARAALEVGATLPAGLDVGGGDPARPESVVEGLLAGHEEVLKVLRHLDAVGGDDAWNGIVGRIAARREAEAAALRVTVGVGGPREPDCIRTGRPPDAFCSPDLLV